MSAKTTKKTEPWDLVVIGGGPAGIRAATEAARHDLSVALVYAGPVAGRAGNASLLPSKVLLEVAARYRREASSDSKPSADAADRAWKDCQAEITRIREAHVRREKLRLQDAGVRVIAGTARFSGPDRVHVDKVEGADELPFHHALVATGSVPTFAEEIRPDGNRLIAPRHITGLPGLPKSLMVIGAGATGAETVHAFNALGVEVIWIIDDMGILPSFDRELADGLGDVLMMRGVKLVTGKRVESLNADPKLGALAKLEGGRTYNAEKAFIATGRRPDIDGLDLAAAGLSPDPHHRGLSVDARGRTEVPSIYAAGDVTGPPYIVNKGLAEAWTAARAIAGLEPPPVDPRSMIHAVYTAPEVAQVGLSAERAQRMAHKGELGPDADVMVYTLRYEEALSGQLLGAHEKAFVRVVSDHDSGRLLGASALGPRAAEVIAPVALAMRLGAPAEALASSFFAHPTLAELAATALR